MPRHRAVAAAAVALVLVACGGGVDGYEGLVTEVTEDEITVDGPDGPRTFTYEPGLVPLEHLEEHRDEELPVVVDWDEGAPSHATSIEDA